MYAVVDSDKAESYILSRGEMGPPICRFDTIDEAREESSKKEADEYYYGVCIIDEDTWEIIE